MSKNSVLEELRIRRLAIIEKEICWRAFWRWEMLESKLSGWKEKSWVSSAYRWRSRVTHNWNWLTLYILFNTTPVTPPRLSWTAPLPNPLYLRPCIVSRSSQSVSLLHFSHPNRLILFLLIIILTISNPNNSVNATVVFHCVKVNLQ